jgi:hypothetical protein
LQQNVTLLHYFIPIFTTCYVICIRTCIYYINIGCFKKGFTTDNLYGVNVFVSPHSNIWNTSFQIRTSRLSSETLPKLFHCSVRNTRATGWPNMAHKTCGLNKILVPRSNCRSTGRFLAILSAKFPSNLCGRLRFFEPKHITRTLYICESSHLDFNSGNARGGGICYYSICASNLQYFSTLWQFKTLCMSSVWIFILLQISFWNTMYVCMYVFMYVCMYVLRTYACIYRVSQEECARLREGVPYGKVYRYNQKHLCPMLNCYGDNGQRKVWSSGGSTHCTCQLSSLINVCPWVWCGVTSALASHVSCIVLGNPEDNYDMRASSIVVQFNGFMSLTS